jgi:glycosyltransferase involved in cell wall biosynthesis
MLVAALYKHLPDFGIEVIPADNMMVAPDVALAIGLSSEGMGQGAGFEQLVAYRLTMAGRRKVKVIIRANENDARKGTNNVDRMWSIASNHADGTVFVSEWMREYFNDSWHCDNNVVIKNGVDHEIFKPNKKLDNGKVNIVAHHWSNNPMKGFDVYDWLDDFVGRNDGFTFTYIGRDRGTFEHTNVIRPLHGRKLGEELGKYDVYVSASRWDPGPNHILEALSCGLPTYVYKDGGGCVEFVDEHAVYNDTTHLENILRSKHWIAHPQLGMSLSDWKSCVGMYADFIRRTYEEQ